ncbi:MAG TPA: molybdenum cofactor guanylyltransferase [Blastocatellia bacterium]|jgi:molybdopterin-guanine dinucleotide biosynthesis protein A|nr:molybdenum cofactor guanylyltransferase [Blastocatellia bacterium]
MDVHGFVTAGGRSSRMGKDKAWLEIDGRPMIQRVVEELRRVTPAVTVIANDPEYDRLGLPVLADLNPDIGPLEAIRVALAASLAPRVLLVACDLPFVTADLLELLLDRVESYQVAVPLSSDGRLEPLCAVYSTEVLEPVTELIRSGERKVSRLFDRVRTRLIPFEDLSQLAGAERFFINVNTPEDYARANLSEGPGHPDM